MKTNAKTRNDKLFEIAEAQQGYFTAKQAETAGFLATNFPYHVQTGAWIKEARSIYRLKHFPLPPRGQLVLYSLWSRDRNDKPQGIYSHETALTIHELSDVMPAKLHMTVSSSFRKSAQTPKVLRLFREDLRSSDYEEKHGFRVTTPIRTILDLINTGETSLEFVEQALVEGVDRGIILLKDLESEKIPKEIRAMFKNWLKTSRSHKKAAG